MKKILALLTTGLFAACVLVFVAVWVAPKTDAQFAGGGFVSGPRIANLLTNETSGTNIFVAVGGGTAPGPSTNLSGLAVQLAVPIGGDGCGVMVNCAGTNATTTTNMTLTFEFSIDGVNYHTNDRITMVVGPLGVGYAPVYSNMLTASLYGTAFGNLATMRLRSIHHTNTGSIFITNLAVSTR